MINHLNQNKTLIWVIVLSLILCTTVSGCYTTDPTSEPVTAVFIGTAVSTGPAFITVEPHDLLCILHNKSSFKLKLLLIILIFFIIFTIWIIMLFLV